MTDVKPARIEIPDDRPITPEEMKQMKVLCIPSFVLKAVNELLVSASKSDRGSVIQIGQDDIIKQALEYAKSMLLPDGSVLRSDFFDNGWLDFEPVYEQAGWDVTYNKSPYYETAASFFTFTPKESS